MDLGDEGSRELQVLEINCDTMFCEPFVQVARMPAPGTDDLVDAALQAEIYLMDQHMINADASRGTARCMARAVGRALGLSQAELEPLAAQPEQTEQAQNPMPSPASYGVYRGGSAQGSTQATPVPSTRPAPVPQPAPMPVPQPAPTPYQPQQSLPKKSSVPVIVVGLVVAVALGSFIALTMFGGAGSEQDTEVIVPAVEGLSLGSALTLLEDAGINDTEVTEEFSDEAPQTVLESNPGSGESVSTGSTVELVVAKERPEEDSSEPQSDPVAPDPVEPDPGDSDDYGPATFSSTSYMDEVWNFFLYYDRTPQTIHNWMLANGFWLDSYSSDCAVYLSPYDTQFVFEQSATDPENTSGYTRASSDDQSPLLDGMRWRVMRVHFWGEGLDYAIDKCHLAGESWRGSADGLPSASSSYLMVSAGAPGARGTSNGYQWEATYNDDSRFCTVVISIA